MYCLCFNPPKICARTYGHTVYILASATRRCAALAKRVRIENSDHLHIHFLASVTRTNNVLFLSGKQFPVNMVTHFTLSRTKTNKIKKIKDYVVCTCIVNTSTYIYNIIYIILIYNNSNLKKSQKSYNL